MDYKSLIVEIENRINRNLKIKKDLKSSIHKAIADTVINYIYDFWDKSKEEKQKVKRAYYFSAEYLVGRAVLNNLICLDLYNIVKKFLKEKGYFISILDEVEDDGLGNGGLGRLAACFLDSAATLKIPLDGYGIKYKYGYFKQIFKDGFQIEEKDDWTEKTDFWSVLVEKDIVEVSFKNQTVLALPYDMPIIGYKNNNINTLRLWEAHSKEKFCLEEFNKGNFLKAFEEENKAQAISAILYPNDDTKKGKVLRLKQQYFFCSASLQDIIKRYKNKHGKDFSLFKDFVAIQLNDTHPVISIAELIRLLCENEKLMFKDAFFTARNVFSYTNHTIMAEALEKWPVEIFLENIPNVYKYILKIREEFYKEMKEKEIKEEVIEKIDIIKDGLIHMANLAIFSSFRVNGVSKIHTEILKKSCLKDWFSVYPLKFQNKTNGITQRRWLKLCNEELSELITKLLKTNRWIIDLEMLKDLKKYADDEEVLEEFRKIKQIKKRQLAKYIKNKDGFVVDVNTIFDVQAKRLHEYKRQFLNILAILSLYFRIKRGEIKDFTPTTFIFGAKAAPSYKRAKLIIKLINNISELIKKDKLCSDLISIVFVENYNVSYAEKIVAACNVSEQISTAGTEASGTGNMKFMLNGAVTLGTYDGANIEIVEAAGRENNYIFGKTVEEIKEIEKIYNPQKIYEENNNIKEVVDALDGGILGEKNLFLELKDSLLKGASWHKPDQYYLFLDFDDFIKTKLTVNKDYKNQIDFNKKCWNNLSSAGVFSSDKTIQNYAKDIWFFIT